MAVVLAVVGFAIRPLVQTVRSETNPVTVAFIAQVQKLAHLPIDPRRAFAADSLSWVIWYIGLPAVLLAAFGAALLARRFLRGSAMMWGLPVMVIGWSVVTTLWKPGIVPDQPWASRRLVPIVLPGMVLFAVWTCGWLVRRARAPGAGQPAQGPGPACSPGRLRPPAAAPTVSPGPSRARCHGRRAGTSTGSLRPRPPRGGSSTRCGCPGLVSNQVRDRGIVARREYSHAAASARSRGMARGYSRGSICAATRLDHPAVLQRAGPCRPRGGADLPGDGRERRRL